jgi:hypothetical protein
MGVDVCVVHWLSLPPSSGKTVLSWTQSVELVPILRKQYTLGLCPKFRRGAEIGTNDHGLF